MFKYRDLPTLIKRHVTNTHLIHFLKLNFMMTLLISCLLFQYLVPIQLQQQKDRYGTTTQIYIQLKENVVFDQHLR